MYGAARLRVMAAELQGAVRAGVGVRLRVRVRLRLGLLLRVRALILALTLTLPGKEAELQRAAAVEVELRQTIAAMRLALTRKDEQLWAIANRADVLAASTAAAAGSSAAPTAPAASRPPSLQVSFRVSFWVRISSSPQP